MDDSLTLLTDLYQLTMAYGYWKNQTHLHESVFHLTFRDNPFRGGFAVCCGLESALDYLSKWRFSAGDVEYLRGLHDTTGGPLFENGFLDFLAAGEFTCDVEAIPEGTIVFPHEPLVRIQGPIWQCQIVETALLNLINFQTLVATKAARVCLAAGSDRVFEFGLRRAQGVDGALTANRSAFVGGCYATSNVLAGKRLGMPIRGTHAHSWVMSFDSELEAFRAYARAMPGNSVFLVDTYDTLEGVRRAVTVGKEMAAEGQRFGGIRLDSGDLCSLSIAARKILDEGGFPDALIVASGDLDEYLIADLKAKGAKIDVWGVGTKLVTCFEQPALGGVYKLGAIRAAADEPWRYTIKRSEQLIKVSNPAVQQVRRFGGADWLGDSIYNLLAPPPAGQDWVNVDLRDPSRKKRLWARLETEDLLTPVIRGGKVVYQSPPLAKIRERTLAQLQSLPAGVKRFRDPLRYEVGLEESLFGLKQELLEAAKKGTL